MDILSIDPGPEQSAVLGWANGKVCSDSGIFPNEEIIGWLPFYPANEKIVAIEMIASFGMPVGREVFETCVWIGRFMQAMPPDLRKCCHRIPRIEVKNNLCHSPRAKDANVRQALIDRYGHCGTKKNPGPLYGIKSHLWSALALVAYAEDKLLTKGEGK